VETEKRVERLLQQACCEVKTFAPGWDRDRLIWEIHSFAVAVRREQETVPLDRRRRIARLARDLDKEIELAGIGIGTVEAGEVFLGYLRLLATFDGFSHSPVWGEASQSLSKRGTRRSRLRSLKDSVLEKTVQLYFEAVANPGFSAEGPLVRFANGIGELTLGTAKPFTSDAVRAECRRMKMKARRIRSLMGGLFRQENDHDDKLKRRDI
jgi:hypothetical protein